MTTLLPTQTEVSASPLPPTLMPCPFCGCTDSDLELQWSSSWWVYISCTNCNAAGPHAYTKDKDADDLTVAAKAWNERTA